METYSARRYWLTKSARVAALVALASIVSACSQTGRWTRADYAVGYELPLAAAEAPAASLEASDLEDVSAKIFLLSDNQRHEQLGGRVDWFRNTFADEQIAAVAIRPPQLDLFGQDLLVETLGMIDGFVLHLGDACDLSNSGEFGRFAWDMRHVSRGWVMAPGNHDGYFYGNSSRSYDYLMDEWDNSGETYLFAGTQVTSRPMQKDRFVSHYLAALILQNAVWSEPLAQHLGPAVQERYAKWQRLNQDEATFADYWITLVGLQDEIYVTAHNGSSGRHEVFELPDGLVEDGEPHLQRIAWHIDKESLWKSFVVQELDIGGPAHEKGGVSVLVLDTASYSMKPMMEYGVPSTLFHNISGGYIDAQIAGETGGIPDKQNAVAGAFAKSMRDSGKRWIIATHHPYDSLGRVPKKRFNNLRDQGGMPVTLSSHTHTGGIRWNNDGDREGAWLEINVGSLLDAPVEFRDLQVHRSDDRYVVSSKRYSVEAELRDRGLIADESLGYRPVDGEPDYYTSYKESLADWASTADFRVKRIVLAAYLRLFRLFPTDLPDDGSTVWPDAPDGSALRDHESIVSAMQGLLDHVEKDNVDALTQFLFALREYERTRLLTEETRHDIRVYRLSQAIWAGQAEYEPSEPDEDLVVMDSELAYFALPVLTSSGEEP